MIRAGWQLACLALLLTQASVANAGEPPPQSARDGDLWAVGDKIQVCVIAPIPEMEVGTRPWRVAIADAMGQWQSANASLTIQLEECSRAPGSSDTGNPCQSNQEIRIAFVGDTDSTTLRGRQSADAPDNNDKCPSMRLSINQLKKAGEQAATGIIAHELGHALGLMHEHQRAVCGVPDAVQRMFARPGLQANEDIPEYVAAQFEPAKSRLLPDVGFQADSVMTYPVPDALRTAVPNDPVAENLTGCLAPSRVRKVSEHDRAVLRAAYPPPLPTTQAPPRRRK